MEEKFEKRLEEVIEEKFKAAGITPGGDLTDEELAKAEELSKDAQDEVKKELGMV